MNKKNTIVSNTDEVGTYVSEIQNFNKPEDYEDAFKKYYPKDETK